MIHQVRGWWKRQWKCVMQQTASWDNCVTPHFELRAQLSGTRGAQVRCDIFHCLMNLLARALCLKWIWLLSIAEKKQCFCFYYATKKEHAAAHQLSYESTALSCAREWCVKPCVKLLTKSHSSPHIFITERSHTGVRVDGRFLRRPFNLSDCSAKLTSTSKEL